MVGVSSGLTRTRALFIRSAVRADANTREIAVTVAFYGFQAVPDVRVVNTEQGWNGWYEERAEPLIEAGFRDQHLHNPFGLHDVPGRNRAMHIDQFELSFCRNGLADREQFAVQFAESSSGAARCRRTSARRWSSGAALGWNIYRDALLARTGVDSPSCAWAHRRATSCWPADVCVGAASSGFTSARCSRLGSTPSVSTTRPTSARDCMDRSSGRSSPSASMIIEPWPKKDREYAASAGWCGSCATKIRLGVVSGSADVESVQARSIGSFLQTRRLCAELDDINTLKVRNGKHRLRHSKRS